MTTDKNEAPELLPCPFCGGEAELGGMDGNLYVRCISCLCDGPIFQHTVAEAISTWNTRSGISPTQSDKDKEIERLREVLIEIERIYYNEGEDVKRRAARMRALASEALEERG